MRWIKIVLTLGLVELVHLLLFSVVVGWLGKWKLERVTDSFDLIAWIWVGMTDFWANGAGAWIVAACAAATGAVILEQFVRWLALARQKNELDRALKRKEEELRAALHAEITGQIVAAHDARERSLNAYKEKLEHEFRNASLREADAEVLQKNALCWKEELQALRNKMEKLKEKRNRMRESAKAVLSSLDRTPANIQEARRHLLRMVKGGKRDKATP